MNLEGSKSTECFFIKQNITENNEGMVIKKPSVEYSTIKGILLPVTGNEYTTIYGAQIKYMYKYLINPNDNIAIGDYISYENNTYEIIEIDKWQNRYYTLILKVILS